MDTRKNIVSLEAFREMLHISPRVPSQSFAELPFEEEILEFLRFLGHSAQIKTHTDVNVNKLFQPWRSFAAVINKCLTGKSSSFDSLRDGILFSTIKVVSRHQNTQQYGAILPIKLTIEDIRNTKACKEYYACATEEAAPKPKASAIRKRGGSDTSTTPPTPIATQTPITTVVAASRLTDAAKGKQQARATSPTDPSDVERTEAEQQKIILRRSRQETHISQQEIESDGESEEEETREKAEESFDPIPRTPKDNEDDGNGEEDQEEEADELYRDVDINQGRGLQVSQDIDDSRVTLTPVHPDGQQESSSTSSFVTSLLNLIIDPGMESIFTTASSSVAPLPSPTSTMTPSIMTTNTTASQPPIPPTPIPSEVLQNLPTFESVFRFEDRVKSLEVNFSEFMRTNQSLKAVSNILDIVHQYMHQEMTKAVKSQVKAQVTRILPRIEESVNAQLEAEVLTRSSHSSRTSYDVAADLSEIEQKKILIDKMEGNKSIQRSDKQRNLYKALVEAYEADKTILDSYGESAILKRRREDDDDQEGPSAGSDWGAKRRREGGEHASANTPSEPATRSAGRNPHIRCLKQVQKINPLFKLLSILNGSPSQGNHHHRIEVYKATTDQLDWVNPEGQHYPYNLLQPLSLVPDNRGHRVIPFEHFINNNLEYLRGGDFKRPRLQDVEDILLLFIQGKLSNLIVEERFAFNVSLRMFTRSIVIQRRVEDLQLGVESYQKRLNFTKPDTYRSDLKRREADGTLSDVRNALDDRLKGIRMRYLPTTIWRKGDEDRAAAMIQAIDKMLKTKRIMRSLE
nr:hypothetical protein [Tanacetum cinerariifolium]